jgi:hypothetical protein
MKFSNTSSVKKTLDIQHTLKINDFQDIGKKISTMRDRILEIDKNLSKLEEEKKKNEDNISDKSFENYLSYIDEKQLLEKNITSLENSTEEVDYYVNTSSLLFQYYDLVENGMHDINNNNTATSAMKESSILKYFVNPSSNSNNNGNNGNIGNNGNNDENNDDNKSDTNTVDDKATLLDKYLSYTESNFIKNINTECDDHCSNCKSENRVIMINDGLIFCNNCHMIEYIIVDHERPSYRDPPRLLWALKSLLWLVYNLK